MDANCVRNMQSYKKPNKQGKLHLVGIYMTSIRKGLYERSCWPLNQTFLTQKQRSVLGIYEYGNKPSDFIKGDEFLQKMRDYILLK